MAALSPGASLSLRGSNVVAAFRLGAALCLVTPALPFAGKLSIMRGPPCAVVCERRWVGRVRVIHVESYCDAMSMLRREKERNTEIQYKEGSMKDIGAHVGYIVLWGMISKATSAGMQMCYYPAAPQFHVVAVLSGTRNNVRVLCVVMAAPCCVVAFVSVGVTAECAR